MDREAAQASERERRRLRLQRSAGATVLTRPGQLGQANLGSAALTGGPGQRPPTT